ncbi:M60 family metallopeptidase [Candidatus Sodalis sp. SoCistrobi]|uniref:M60 family metallopeptidase n=1 Tax=Candidatus Sodalis sp. SoCistrobi TaxID=1922216 RepID=UPI00093AD1CB|nr:M60 family metallopeptidase [Candidatus Sodalis sp. SoCistrobi]
MKTFTIHGNGSAIAFRDLQRRSLRHSELRPVGFYAQKGDKITLTVRGETNELVFAQVGIPDMDNTTTTPLTRGENTFTAAHDGLLSFINKNTDCEVEITLDSELMRIPSFRLGVDSNETFFAEMDKYPKAPIILLSSKRADIVVQYNSAVNFLTDPDSLMHNVEHFLQAQETISGLQANGRYDYGLDPNKMLYVEVNHGYMFCTEGYMVFHGEGALQRLLTTPTSWGVWHESGHQMQQHPAKWSDGTGMTEVTVNLYSMAAQEAFLGRASWLDDYYPRIHAFLDLEEKNYDTQDLPIKLGMLWQLRLAFGEAFHPQVHQAYRVMDELPTTSQERKNTFIRVCCAWPIST